jgi:hypothetical protein
MLPSGIWSFGVPFLLIMIKQGNSAIRTDGTVKATRIILGVVKHLGSLQSSSSHPSVFIIQTKHATTAM